MKEQGEEDARGQPPSHTATRPHGHTASRGVRMKIRCTGKKRKKPRGKMWMGFFKESWLETSQAKVEHL